MPTLRRLAALACASALLAACGNKAATDTTPPLGYAPADTPFAWGNIEPMPAAALAAQSRQMHAIWPLIFKQYDAMLAQMPLEDREHKIATAVLDELRGRDTFDKLREIGFKPDGHFAIYGVGLAPVARMELSDAAAFQAMIARIEAKVGEKIATGKLGDQAFWRFGDDKGSLVIAIEGNQLVATAWANDVADQVKSTLLGLDKPAKSVLDAGTLQAISKQYGYTAQGAGFVDAVALVQRLGSAPTGTDLALAKAFKLPTEGAITDPTCKAEYLSIAHNFPRLVMGVEEVGADHMKLALQIEIVTPLAKQIMDTVGTAPGTGGPGQGLIEYSLAMPVLKLKDFWLKQADAVAAKPYACAQLAGINEMFASSRGKVDVTIPPPMSDITGMRVVVTRLVPGATMASMPDYSGKVFVGSSNPLVAIGMAQMALPQLKDLKLTTDGKPVTLPAGLAPGAPPLTVVASDKGIAVAAGKGEEADLGAFLNAPVASTPVFARMHITGALYGLIGKFADLGRQMMPHDKAPPDQTELFAVYEKMIKSADFTFEANANGIAIHETVDSNPAN